MDTLQALKERRSCRKYLDRQVDPAVLEQILEAGTYAPTGRNKQSPVIVVVQDKETIQRLSVLNGNPVGMTGDPFYGAPTLLIVLADSTVSTHIHDGALVMGNLMNAAHALGVDSCYIFRAKEMLESDEGKAYLEKWGIPSHYVGVGNCILGYRDEGGVRPVTPRKEGYIVYADRVTK